MRARILNYLRAGYPGIYLLSTDEARVEAELEAIAQTLDCRLYSWSVTAGLVDTTDGQTREAPDPLELLRLVGQLPNRALVLLRDFHQFLAENRPVLTRALKDCLRILRSKGNALLLLGCRRVLPPELESEFLLVPWASPSREELGLVLDRNSALAQLPKPVGEHRESLLDAASGLTTEAAARAFALSVIERGALDPGIVSREKINDRQPNGLLEVTPSAASLEDIGGLDMLKEWLLSRRNAFGQEAKAYGLPRPKGLLIVGIPGTGKSLIARATATLFNRPLLRLDAGRFFLGAAGQSEASLHSALATVEALAPCVLWIDKLERTSSGTPSSGGSDSGAGSAVVATCLSWLRDMTAPVFVVATANDVPRVSPDFLSKGRFDEFFFVDLPSQEEREAIWRIQIIKYSRKPDGFDIPQLARSTQDWTGAEIEQAFVEALYYAFSAQEELTNLSVTMQLGDILPLSRLMVEEIAVLREWAKRRTRRANRSAPEHDTRRILACA